VKVLPGRLVFGSLTKLDVSAITAGATLLTTSVVITSVVLPSLLVGDRIIASFMLGFTKGVTGGATAITLNDAGAGNIQWAHNSSFAGWNYFNIPANEFLRVTVTVVGRCVGAGSPTLTLAGSSQGSNTDVANSNGELRAWVLPGS